ncbi:MAG: type II toxin-antitoxin system VapC family toxin [Deltaproteobacteria bacterium]|nr:type II toxin-antitoxin system VapC family toxin [Deltaproteobacteria bacterium]
MLLDTCVISEIVRPRGSQRVKDRVAAFQPEDVYLSVVTIGEMTRGVALLAAGNKRRRFDAALLRLEQDYADRILPVDTDTAKIWGELDVARQRAGLSRSVADGLIAATAKRHGLHVVTRNVRDFEGSGVLVTNPWEDA